jgi:hypothetical protein
MEAFPLHAVSLVSGEKFQELAHLVCYKDITSNISRQALGVSSYGMFRIGKDNPERFSGVRIIFVYANCLDEFIKHHAEHIVPGTILISHNEDNPVEDRHLILFEKGVSKWYAQNALAVHPKLEGIPIGIANSQWKHGNAELLSLVRAKAYRTKFELVCKNFAVGTNSPARTLCLQQTKRLCEPFPSTIEEFYWRKLASSKFVISPPGNGVDCHRIWESLYLRTVPIVLRNPALRHFEHLPILFIDSWTELTRKKLESIWEERFSTFNWEDIKELSIDYWKCKINSSLTHTA